MKSRAALECIRNHKRAYEEELQESPPNKTYEYIGYAIKMAAKNTLSLKIKGKKIDTG